MIDLTFQDLARIRDLSRPESLKGCARAYAIAVTYFPVLIMMAEKYLKLSMTDRVKNGYSVGIVSGNIWCVKGSDGFEERIGSGDACKITAEKLVTRLNGLI